MILKDNGKINFIIDLFLDLDNYISGGLISLHKLAYLLAEQNHNVYIFCKPAFPHKNITTIPSQVEIIEGHKHRAYWEMIHYNNDNTVAIYPEHGYGNKFNTKYVARWIMYHTTREDEENFNENDFIFNYGNFKTNLNRENGKLRIVDYNLDKFYDEKLERNGFCHILGKQTPNNHENILNVFNSVDITKFKNNINLNLLRKEFNKYKYFLTFDEKTYLSTAAALCGCKTIILKNSSIDNKEELLPIQYRIENPEFMFGVAYGIEDLAWAEKTQYLVREHITELDKTNVVNVNQFIKFWVKKLNLVDV